MINSLHSTANNAESSQWFGWVSIWTESKLKASLDVMCVLSKWPENTVVKSLFCFLHNRLPSISKYFSHNFQWEPIRITFVSIVFQQRVVFLCYKTLNSFPRTFRLKAFCINFSFCTATSIFPYLRISKFILLSCIIFLLLAKINGPLQEKCIFRYE